MNKVSLAVSQERWWPKAFLVSGTFFLMLTALYLIKPLNRTLFINTLGADRLPYAWIFEAGVLTILLPFYRNRLKEFLAYKSLSSSFWILLILLLLFRINYMSESGWWVLCFYVSLDIFSVLMVENFWSLTNVSFKEEHAKAWYGVMACGGLVGGFAGSLLAGTLPEKFGIPQPDLIWVAIAILAFTFAIFRALVKKGVVNKMPNVADDDEPPEENSHVNRFVLCLVLLLLMAQLCEPIIEYLMMKSLETSVLLLEERAKYLSFVFMGINGFGLFINLIVLPVLYRYRGAVSGLFLQPILLSALSITFLWSKSLDAICVLKIADRGLAYSSGRASRELLYRQLPPKTIFGTKTLVDIYGYYLAKVAGSVAVVAITLYLSPEIVHRTLGGFLSLICVTWLALIYVFSNFKGLRPKG